MASRVDEVWITDGREPDKELNARERFEEWKSKQRTKKRKIGMWQYLIGLFIGLVYSWTKLS